MQNSEFTHGKSTRGGRIIFKDGHIYNRMFDNIESVYYKCRKKDCKASMSVMDNVILRIKDNHNHPIMEMNKSKKQPHKPVTTENHKTDKLRKAHIEEIHSLVSNKNASEKLYPLGNR
jgi:hypothetical protein